MLGSVLTHHCLLPSHSLSFITSLMLLSEALPLVAPYQKRFSVIGDHITEVPLSKVPAADSLSVASPSMPACSFVCVCKKHKLRKN